jgi:transposase
MMKRQIFGRANFDLLRKRVLLEVAYRSGSRFR